MTTTFANRQAHPGGDGGAAKRKRQDELAEQQAFERRMGVPERYITGAVSASSDVDGHDHQLEDLSEPASGAALMAQRGELDESRKRIVALGDA